MWSILHDIAIVLFLGPHLVYRFARGLLRGDPSTGEYTAYRAGLRVYQLKTDGRPLLWLHGVSVGEVLALDNLIAVIRAQTHGRVAIAVSTMTADGLRMIRKFSNQPDIAFIFPLDVSWLARRVVRRLRPRVLAILDGDFWFQMLRACRAGGVPVMVINGRLSERSERRYSRFRSYARQLFSGIVQASVQSKTMADRFARFLPSERIVIDGNIKLDSQPRVLSADQRAELRRSLGIDQSRMCIVFGSIHPAELDILAEPIRHIIADHRNVQIVIVPRHPDKFTPADVGKHFQPGTVIWVNRLGVLRDLYQLADVALVGGTFCGVGGHNLAEPALLGAPVLYGPNVSAQVPLHEILQAYGAGRQVQSADELAQAMAAMIEDPALRASLARNASRLQADSAGLTARIAERILTAAGGE
jgi:3-deoxy-D-manno-octulosonic-acid transferase